MQLRSLAIRGVTPTERGRDRGRQVAGVVRDHWRVYLDLFALAGWSERDVREHAQSSLDSLRDWWPAGHDEVLGICDGTGLDFTQAAALASRTELLIARGGPDAEVQRECTILGTVSPAAAAQVWDWHDELSDAWHVQTVRGGPLAYAGVTEHGICAKVGMNERGVGVLLAIMSHQDDRAGGVPIHAVLHRILSESATVEAAVDIARDAQLSSSSALLILGPDAAGVHTVRMLELAPGASAEVVPQQGWHAHTNHFLDRELACGSRTFRGDPDSVQRMQLLHSRFAEVDGSVRRADDIVPLLRTQPGIDPANICCVPREDQAFGGRWRTLATVGIDMQALTIRDGSPLDAQTPTLRIPLAAI